MVTYRLFHRFVVIKQTVLAIILLEYGWKPIEIFMFLKYNWDCRQERPPRQQKCSSHPRIWVKAKHKYWIYILFVDDSSLTW